MLFYVGPWVYRVEIARTLVNDKQEPLMGRCDLDSMVIYVAAEVSPQARLNVVLHELRHAWRYHFPAPRTDEEEADFSATITAAAMADFKRQGGPIVLLQMRPKDDPAAASVCEISNLKSEIRRRAPLRLVASAETMAPARAGRAQCGICGSIIPDGAIASSSPRDDAEAKGAIVTRTLYCGHCDHLQSWDEALAGGWPSGVVVRGPLYVREPAAVEKFLTEHPEAAGMLIS